MRKIEAYILIIGIFLFCSGCSLNTEKLPGIDIPISDMNHEMQLIPNPGGGNKVPRNKSSYLFQIKNLSTEVIVFSGDFGKKLFMKKGKNWVEVEDMLDSPDVVMQLLIDKEDHSGQVFGIMPFIDQLDHSVTLRVVIVGHLTDQSGRLVGAYTDITLNP